MEISIKGVVFGNYLPTLAPILIIHACGTVDDVASWTELLYGQA